MAHRLQSFLRPKSIALVGATERSTWSNAVVANLRACGFSGRMFLVNPRGGTAYGQAVHSSVREIQEPVDLAYLMVPTSAIDDALADLASAGIAHAVIITSGFAEAGPEGQAQQAALRDKARAHGVALIGPNCLGFINQVDNIPMWAIALPSPMLRGSLAIVSQSGATSALMAFFAAQQGIGFSYLVSTGNEVDVDLAQVVDYLVDDPDTRAISIFLETVRNPATLAAACARAHAARKPIVVMKIGASEITARSAQAHTGALVGDDRVFDAACRRLGLVRVPSIEDAVFTADTLSRLGPVEGKLGFASMSGGFCEIAADRADAEGVPLATLSHDTENRLRAVLPGFGTPHNPLDTTGAVMLDPTIMSRALAVLADDPEVGAIAVSYDVPTHAGEDNTFRRGVITEIQRAMGESSVPSIQFSYTLRPVNDYAKQLLPAQGARYVGCGAHHGMVALKSAFAWSRHVLAPRRADPAAPAPAGVRPDSENATLDYLASRGVPVIPRTVAISARAATLAAGACGYPVALKIASPDIAHKTEVGGVALGLRDAAAVEAARGAMLDRVRAARPDARIDGVLVAPMRHGGIELFVGTLRDAQWGPVLAVGLGGVYVEVLKDTALLLLPVTPQDVLEMLSELRGSALLDGFRGTPAADRGRIAQVVADIGDAALALGDGLVSLEVNPLRVDGSDCEALDALAVWDEAADPAPAEPAPANELATV